eukprot:1179477-Pyramimonas_sp.AAC.1
MGMTQAAARILTSALPRPMGLVAAACRCSGWPGQSSCRAPLGRNTSKLQSMSDGREEVRSPKRVR